MAKRIAHKLKPNKNTYLPKKFIFFDTETYPVKVNKDLEIHKLKLGWLCLWQRSMSNRPEMIKWYYFETVKDFWDFINSNLYAKERIVLIAHNFVYDFTMVKGWTAAIKNKYKLTRLYEKNHVFIARYKKSDRSILCLDNMNFFICSLEQLGKEVGLPKLNIDFDNCTNEQLSIYCKRDTEILLKTWQKYIKWFTDNDLGNFGVTISAQSFNSFRHKFMKHNIYIHNRKYVSTLERESYYGGRTECFKIGHFTKSKFYYLDINSMYPAVMIDNFYPIKYFNYKLNMSNTELKFSLEKYCGIARVILKTDQRIFPVRGKMIKKPKSSNRSLFENNEYKSLKYWIKQKGGVRSEHIKVNGKLKVREEYLEIPVYYKNKNGIPADVLASSLRYENPELANYFKIGDFEKLPGDRLLDVLKNEPDDLNEVDYMENNDLDQNSYCKPVKNDYEKSGKVIFPIGRFETVLSTPELKVALKLKLIEKIVSVALYERGTIFKDFIDFFYNERIKAKQTDNYAYSLFFKLIMNSLYGKFGQMSGEWQTRGKCDPLEVDYWNETIQGDRHIYKMRKINGLIQKYERKEESFNSFCAISSHVTSYARIKLWDLMSQAKMENVYYCDTDSIFTNEQGYENLKAQIDIAELGKLKIEAETDNLKIIGCKHYQFGSKVRHKGRKKDAQMINPNTFKQKQWSSLTRLIHNRDLNNFQVINIVKTFTHLYDKGLVQDNGEVKPLIL